MEMVELAAETQEKIINFLSHHGIATGDALCFLSKHEIKMGKHKDLRSSLDDLHKLHACLRFGDRSHQVQGRADQHAGSCGAQASAVASSLQEL